MIYAGGSAAGQHVRFLDVASGELTTPITDPDGEDLLAWLPDEDHRVITAAGSALRVRDSTTGNLRAERVVSPAAVTAIATMKDGRHLIVGDDSGGMVMIESDSLTATAPRLQLSGAVAAIAQRAGMAATAVLDDGSVVAVDFTDGSAQVSSSIGMRPSAVAVSPDGARLAIGGPYGEVGMWDLESDEWVAPPAAGHRQFVTRVAFSGDGRTIVTTSFDGGVWLWEGTTGEPIAGVDVGTDQSPAFGTVPPDGSAAVVATRDGAVYRIDTRFDQWAAFACAVADRNLSAEEWQSVFGDRQYHETCPTS